MPGEPVYCRDQQARSQTKSKQHYFASITNSPALARCNGKLRSKLSQTPCMPASQEVPQKSNCRPFKPALYRCNASASRISSAPERSKRRVIWDLLTISAETLDQSRSQQNPWRGALPFPILRRSLCDQCASIVNPPLATPRNRS